MSMQYSMYNNIISGDFVKNKIWANNNKPIPAPNEGKIIFRKY